MASKKGVLTLQEKVDLRVHEQEKLSVRNLTNRFDIGKTQAAEIMEHKDELLNKFHSHVNPKQKRRLFKTEGLNIDKLCYEWFVYKKKKYLLQDQLY